MSLLQDSLFIVGALFLFVIVAAALGLMLSSFNAAVQGNADIDSRAKTDIGNLNQGWGGVMDWFLVALLIGLPLASMGLAHLNRVPAVFFYMVIAVLFLMVFVGWGLQGAFENIQASGGGFSAYLASDMPLTSFIMSNFGLYSLLIVLIIGYGTYAKSRQAVYQ